MKKILPLALGLLVLVVAASGCTGDQWSSNKTYSGNGLKIVYPGSWSDKASQFPSLENSTQIMSVGNDGYGLRVDKISIPGASILPSTTILNGVSSIVKSSTNGTVVSEKEINVDGASGFQINLSNKTLASGNEFLSYAVWIKNDTIYVATYGSKNNDTGTFDKIIANIKSA
jgi:hypothetical protein